VCDQELGIGQRDKEPNSKNIVGVVSRVEFNLGKWSLSHHGKVQF